MLLLYSSFCHSVQVTDAGSPSELESLVAEALVVWLQVDAVAVQAGVAALGQTLVHVGASVVVEGIAPAVIISYFSSQLSSGFLRACEAVPVYKSILSPSSSSSSSSSGHLVESINIQAREVLEHRLLRPLSSEMRSEVTSEVTGSLRGHFQRNCHSSGTSSQPRNASSSLLHSLVVKALDFGARGPRFESRFKHL